MTHLWPLLQAQSVWKTLYTSYIIQKASLSAPQLLATSKGCGKGLSHNLWESFLGYLHSSVTFQMRVANLNFNYQPFRQILVPIIKRRKQQKTWKIWISNQSLGNLIFCRVGVLNWPNFHLSSSMVLRKSSSNAIFFKCDFALGTSDNLVTETVFKLKMH